VVSLGAFVIHGNARSTLGPCLDSLVAVADEVVTVDSGSDDGSAELVRERGLTSVQLPWQGYGAARARAAELLSRHDYLFYLDSDERLGEGGVQAFSRWRASSPALPYYYLCLEDWAELDGRRFLYRRETKKRVVRRDMATWTPAMIVHESLPRAPMGRLEATIVHRFATSVDEIASKQARYAVLWAVLAHRQGRRAPLLTLGPLRELTHVVRDAVIKGALFRGGRDGLRLARAVARYHGDKYRTLARVEEGHLRDLEVLLERGELEHFFRAVNGTRSGSSGTE
jgi:(heptosyl)LPS beta-1,4-glucosyltransferase